MSDSFANAQLELACQVGSRQAIEEAIAEGADINFGGSSPLITAILNGDRETVTILVDLGADVSCFELKVSDREQVIEALMRSGPGGNEVPEEDPVDAKQLRALDKMIRTKGFAEPCRKGRAEELASFADGLKWVAAEECLEVVQAFLQQIDPCGVAPEALKALLEEKATEIEALNQRYVAAEEAPAELLKEYLKERKKLAK